MLLCLLLFWALAFVYMKLILYVCMYECFICNAWVCNNFFLSGLALFFLFKLEKKNKQLLNVFNRLFIFCYKKLQFAYTLNTHRHRTNCNVLQSALQIVTTPKIFLTFCFYFFVSIYCTGNVRDFFYTLQQNLFFFSLARENAHVRYLRQLT
ncbi:maker281 [Drosophila busckii]|uniref:Maker281 n=1 Tax=Drosophila busckii TaxID=30019 RepID=A0A0M4ELW6_DROBS|nr:maker281 [Drosophila busckii]